MYKFSFQNVPSSLRTTDSFTDDSGTDTTSKNDSLSPGESCLVCGALTRGMHFQVATCRACAAFFRRSVKDKKVYRCRRGARSCDLTKPPNGKPICRFCRLQKCYAVGMRIEGSRDEIPSTSTSSNPSSASVSASGSADSPEEFPVYAQVTHGNRLMNRDIDKLIENIKDILRSNNSQANYYVPNGVHTTPFQQIQYAVAKLREEVCPSEPLPIADSYDKMAYYPFQEQYSLKVAKLMMSCEPFVKLPFEDKYKLFKHGWVLIYELERMFSSVEMFGNDVTSKRLLVTKDIAIDVDQTGVYATGMNPAKFEELVKFCFPVKQRMFEILLNPMKQLQITQFELSYMIGLIIFSVTEVRGLAPETKEIGEQVLDSFSSELHNFYIYEFHLPNYAARHAKLVRLISCALQHVHEMKDYMIMAKIFDLFICDLYESELFN
uniref:Uncharacterized protein n=1 Tax=Panagrolaimus davidi TaxID=227884 RepID=A0A914QSM1_9BILA